MSFSLDISFAFFEGGGGGGGGGFVRHFKKWANPM